MRYKSGGAFRQALEERLRLQNQETGLALFRLRKMVAFDRFLARLVEGQPEAWVLKGGFALQLRLGLQSRTTKDIDLALRDNTKNLFELLQQCASVDLKDWFSFEIPPSDVDTPADRFGGIRYSVLSLLDGRTFEDFHVDVGINDPIIGPLEVITAPTLLEFAGISPVHIPICSLEQQIAEKLHAFTRPHPSGASSRTKDLVDILLVHNQSTIDEETLVAAVRTIFDLRGTHEIPNKLGKSPTSASGSYRNLTRDLGLEWRTFDDALEAAQSFIDPILQRAIGVE